MLKSARASDSWIARSRAPNISLAGAPCLGELALIQVVVRSGISEFFLSRVSGGAAAGKCGSVGAGAWRLLQACLHCENAVRYSERD